MATTTRVCVETFIANEDFRGGTYKLVKIVRSGTAGRVAQTAAAEDQAIGVLWEHIPTRDSSTVGRAVGVARLSSGKLKMIAAGAIQAGQWLIPDASGRVSGTGTRPTLVGQAVGVALEDATAAGQIIQVAAQLA